MDRRCGDRMKRIVPADSNGVPYRHPRARIRQGEIDKIASEIACDYRKYEGKQYAVHTSWGLDGRPYDYFFENHGRTDINIYKRKRNYS